MKIINRLYRPIIRLCAELKWRRLFPGNTRLGINIVGTNNIIIGRGSYGFINILTSDPNPHLHIGSFCSIAQEVTFVIGNNHPTKYFSTFPFRAMFLHEPVREALGNGGIQVSDDVWIGYRATILDGVTIGRGGGCRSRGCCHQRCPPLYHRWRCSC